MAKNQKTITSEFYCVECGQRGIPIARRVGKERETGHLKKLFCLHCRKETNHAEVRPYGAYNLEDFQEEFQLGRFVNGHKIPVSELTICSKAECPYNKHSRCWNSNYSFNCGHRVIKEMGKKEETINLVKRGW